ncbi:CpsD/CapB family tyrosine-protein kinase [Roseovarius salinarum]|uniref:CpsD/CapB family tyrosine-protein kinase n=1 Tax=Roseovarius salinarum TaxID=1981892 RepID=UPI0018E42BF2|nr:CpsD/CapB family tyrosine-protein kinase [Roseovarius salinarum]
MERFKGAFGPTGQHGAKAARRRHAVSRSERDMPFDLALRRRIVGASGEAGTTEQLPGPSVLEGEIAVDPLAASAWDNLRYAQFVKPRDAALVGRDVPGVRDAMDQLRTQLLQVFRERSWSRVAVTAPTRGCGTTFTAANLALGIAGIAEMRTLLLDLNQRHPGVASALGVRATGNISRVLCGEAFFMDHLLRHSEGLALGVNDGVPDNPAEILHSRRADEMLDRMTATLCPDVVICDLPPMLECDDLTAFLPKVDCVLVVADGTRTLASELETCERKLDGKAPLLGVVLNRGRENAR